MKTCTSTVQWIGGQKFVGTDSTNHSVVLSTKDEGVGMRPSELVLVALGACSSVDVVDILAKKRTPLISLTVTVTGEQDDDPPWPYRDIYINYKLQGRGLTTRGVEQAIELSEQKYCSVAATLCGIARIHTSYEILPEEQPA